SVRGCTASARDSCTRSSCRSTIRTAAPSACSWAASVSPVGPAPTTRTSRSARTVIARGSSPLAPSRAQSWPGHRALAAAFRIPIFAMDATDRKIIAELEAEGRLTVTALAQQVNRVATADLAAYQNLRDEKLATLPGVQRLTSTILMKRVVDERPSIVSPP